MCNGGVFISFSYYEKSIKKQAKDEKNYTDCFRKTQSLHFICLADKFVLTVSRVVGMFLASNSAFAEIGGRGHKTKA